MDTTWLVYDGESGLNEIFDEAKNKSKKHRRDDALVPFKTKTDRNQYEDFSGVVGAFSRLLSDVVLPKKLDKDTLKQRMHDLVKGCSEEEFEKLYAIVENMYFEEGKLLPINAKALSYIESNISQQQVAEYLFSLFVDNTDLKDVYEVMSKAEDTNVLEKLVFETLENEASAGKESVEKADCLLPYVKEVFDKDFRVLTSDTTMYQEYISRFLSYYYMFYVSQLAIKLNRFESGDRNAIEKVYITLYEEVVTRVRSGYEFGWKYVKEKLSHMFSHSVVLEMLSSNVDGTHMDYIAYYNKFRNSDKDESVSAEISNLTELYKKWIPLDYDKCHHDASTDADCKTSIEIKKLFEIVDYQFINGGRKSHYNGYNKKFIDFVQKNFGKFRGTYGYTLSVHESDVILFTRIILLQNSGKIRLAKMFEEFEKRGLLFDRESQKRIVELYEKMNLLEKRSDSGDAQYVKYIL